MPMMTCRCPQHLPKYRPASRCLSDAPSSASTGTEWTATAAWFVAALAVRPSNAQNDVATGSPTAVPDVACAAVWVDIAHLVARVVVVVVVEWVDQLVSQLLNMFKVLGQSHL